MLMEMSHGKADLIVSTYYVKCPVKMEITAAVSKQIFDPLKYREQSNW